MATFVLSLLMAAIGVALIVEVVGGHAGLVSPRLLLGCCSSPPAPGGMWRRGSRRASSAAGERATRRSAAAGRASAGSPARSRVIVRAQHRLAGPVHGRLHSLASAIYFSLGVIAGHALGLTPLVFLIAALLFVLTAMTYVEGASLHQDRGGSTVFARYAFNELVSFVAGWAILLDYVILIAVTAYSATQYLKVFWHPLGNSGEALGLSLAFIALVVLGNIRGFGGGRARRVGCSWRGDLRCRASSCARAGAVLQPAHAARPDPPGQRAHVVAPRVRDDRRGDLLHQPRVRLRPGGGGADQPRGPQAPGRQHHRDGRLRAMSASRSWRSPRCPYTTATRRSPGAT